MDSVVHLRLGESIFLSRSVTQALAERAPLTIQLTVLAAGLEAVGAIMRTNYDPEIPCHRVVAGNGIGGYSAEGGVETKRQLLRLEGVTA